MAAISEDTGRDAGRDTGGSRLSSESVTAAYVENIRDSRTNFIVLLLAQLYCLITIAATQDAALWSTEITQTLPIIDTPISAILFYLLAPVFLIALFLHTMMHLKSFWTRAVRQTRRRGDDLEDLLEAHPWSITAALTRRFVGLGWGGIAGAFEYFASLIFGYFSTAIVLLMIWARFLVKLDLPVTIYHAALTSLAFTAAVYFLLSTKAQIQERAHRGFQAFARGVTILLAFVIPFAGLIAASLWFFEARDAYCREDRTHCDTVKGTLQHFEAFGFGTAADLSYSDISTRPDNWFPTAEMSKEELQLVKGADLAGVDMRYAQARNAFLINAKMPRATLRLGDFSHAWMQIADLRQADLSHGALDGAQLQYAFLDQAQMAFGGFADASLREASLNFSDARNADFSSADFEGAKGLNAILAGARLERARFPQAEFNGADFQGATLSNADLSGGRFANANFSNAAMNDVRAENATFENAIIHNVAAPRARFETAVFAGAKIKGLRTFLTEFDRATFDKAAIEDSELVDSQFIDAVFRSARLERVDFSNSDLRGASFSGATLREVTLSGALLDGAQFRETDLRSVKGLTQAQLNKACGDASTRAPAGLALPVCPGSAF